MGQQTKPQICRLAAASMRAVLTHNKVLFTHVCFPFRLANLATANGAARRMRANGDGDDACDCLFNATCFVNTNKHR
jgi:hypothetical protein